MTPERWQTVEEIFQAALDRPEPERAEVLARACAGDVELQRETTSLIEAYDAAGEFLEQSALERDAQILIDDRTLTGVEMGPYTIIEPLGSGGMGEVYLANDQRLGRRVALKILPPYFVTDADRLRRFQTEARAASALNHANILTVYEVGKTDDLHFIATEYIEGETIRELIERNELTLGKVIDIAIQLLNGLAAAHAAGIVHRDIKPDNIMRRNDGVVKILDFGIAKLAEPPANEFTTLTHRATSRTELGAVLGTIAYLSPEQARGLPVDERTDIWSCGVVLYEMLSGGRPFSGATNADTVVSILERTPAPLFGLAPRNRTLAMMQSIIEKALNKNSDHRYQSAAEMLSDLNRIQSELTTIPRRRTAGIAPETNVIELRKLAVAQSNSRRPYAVSIAAVMVLAMIVAGFFYRRSASRVAPPATRPNLYTQMNEAEQLRFISEQEQRIASMMGDRPMKLNDDAVRVIKSHVDYYLARQAGATPNGEVLSARYQRAKPYIPVIARAFNARRIPVIVGIYLAMFESAYHPCAENSWGAKGLFQFLPQTAEHYGVARADMCDVEKMAPAAAHYIADRMAELGDDAQSMTLVLLSYNRGAEGVREALRQLRETDQNYERNFWTLFANRDKLDESFRKESANYVPGFFAVAIIGENPEVFELGTPPLSSLAR